MQLAPLLRSLVVGSRGWKTASPGTMSPRWSSLCLEALLPTSPFSRLCVTSLSSLSQASQVPPTPPTLGPLPSQEDAGEQGAVSSLISVSSSPLKASAKASSTLPEVGAVQAGEDLANLEDAPHKA